jgi:hypothetical protein
MMAYRLRQMILAVVALLVMGILTNGMPAAMASEEVGEEISGEIVEQERMDEKISEMISGLKNVYYSQTDGCYYVDAKVYLLYSNVIPENIQQAYGANLFGPSGDNKPYVTVAVNVSQLLKDSGVMYEKKGSNWYISYQTCQGMDAKTLWNTILEAMNPEGRAFFFEYFQGNYIGYVLKAEDDGGHIDGVYEVAPAYLTEIYVNNKLEQTFFGEEPHNFNSHVLNWLDGEFGEISWDAEKTYGVWQQDEGSYSITHTKGNAFNQGNGSIHYVEKTSNFFVASFFYETQDITPVVPIDETEEKPVEEPIEETKEEPEEEQVEETKENPVEEQVEETKEKHVEKQVEETKENPVEEQVEETKENHVEKQVEETKENPVEEQVEETKEEPKEEFEEIQLLSEPAKPVSPESPANSVTVQKTETETSQPTTTPEVTLTATPSTGDDGRILYGSGIIAIVAFIVWIEIRHHLVDR